MRKVGVIFGIEIYEDERCPEKTLYILPNKNTQEELKRVKREFDLLPYFGKLENLNTEGGGANE